MFCKLKALFFSKQTQSVVWSIWITCIIKCVYNLWNASSQQGRVVLPLVLTFKELRACMALSSLDGDPATFFFFFQTLLAPSSLCVTSSVRFCCSRSAAIGYIYASIMQQVKIFLCPSHVTLLKVLYIIVPVLY